MKIAWDDMTRREKIMVAMGGVILLMLISYLIFVKPVRDEYARLQTEVPAKRADLHWMRSVAVEQNNGTLGGQMSGGGETSLLKKIDQSARQHKISTSLTRVEPVGNSGVKLWLENVLYTDFLGWLRSLATGNMFTVSSLSVERTQMAGQVSVRLSLEQR